MKIIINLLKLLKPDYINYDLETFDFNVLKKLKITNIFIDLDNTIVSRYEFDVSKYTINKFNKLENEGFKFYIISNNSKPNRVNKISSLLNIEATYLSLKPLTWTIGRIIKNNSLNKDSCIIIGDQLFTDILTGKLLNISTMLVKPLSIEKNYFRRKMIELERNIIKLVVANV